MINNRISIQCTIGPACNTVESLEAMLAAGMDMARINLSHGSAASQQDKLDIFRAACRNQGADESRLMFDICGPEVRVVDLPDGPLIFETGDEVILPEVNYGNFHNEVAPGTEILIDDGKVRFVVTEIVGTDIHCKVTMGGEVYGRKGVNVPEVKLQMDYLGERDREDLLWCIEHGVKYIAASFIRRADDVRTLRRFLQDNGGSDVRIIAKIECLEAVNNLEEIAAEADQILVARGDLGVEIGFEKVPGVQKRLIRKCRELDKPVIVATQLLDSMTHCQVPTRAEVSDVANAVYDGATGLLVTGETASGEYPVCVVKELADISEQALLDLSRYGEEIL